VSLLGIVGDDSGDHLHPNVGGCVAEGQAFPLALFGRR
jgi:hypothetical protein